MIFNSIINLVGKTPLVLYKTSEKINANIYIKLESYNPTGSIKDRACIYHIKNAIKNGSLTRAKTILDASSGNMACSLAFFGKILGYGVKVFCNTKLTQDKRQFIEYYDAELEVFGDFTIDGNRKCKELSSSIEGKDKFCFMDQLHNPLNPIASYETLAPEIVADINNPAAVVGSLGSGGSMCGVARFFKERFPKTKIFTVQACSGTKIPGTGAFLDGEYHTPFINEINSQPLFDDTFFVSLNEAEERTKQLAAQGIFTGIQGGGVLNSAIKGIIKHDITGDVVIIIGDSGWKNMDKLKNIK